MAKFGKKYRQLQIKEWQKEYIDYKALKHFIKEKKEYGTSEDKKEEENENDLAINLINSHRQITDEEISNSPILIIKEEDGNIFNGNEIKINAGGMINGIMKLKMKITKKKII